MKTLLNKEKGYSWFIYDNFYFKGYILLQNKCLREQNAINHIKAALQKKAPAIVCKELNGNWSFIYENNEHILFAVDRLRSMPLFYAQGPNNKLLIGDDAQSIIRAMPCKTIDRLSLEDFKASGLFITGCNTLYNELKQVQASELCLFNKKNCSLEKQTYFTIRFENYYSDNDIEGIKREFDSNHEKIGKDMIKALNGRTAIITLSGGCDSRLIASLLKKENYEKVICFTYGRKQNAESAISKKVAESLGYRWLMVPYSRKMFCELRHSRELADYRRFAFSYASLPHLQDWPAVKYIKENNLIPKDSVFIPGHTGDLLSGGHIEKNYLNTKLGREEFLKTLFEQFYPVYLTKGIQQKFCDNYLQNADYSTSDKKETISEWFNIRERQAKYIVNSVRVYEFFGYEWLTPLWYNQQFDFWQRVSLALRYKRRLYLQLIGHKLPSTADPSFKQKAAEIFRKIPVCKQVLRKAKHMLNYFLSPLCFENLLRFKEYAGYVLLRPYGFFFTHALQDKFIKSLEPTKRAY